MEFFTNHAFDLLISAIAVAWSGILWGLSKTYARRTDFEKLKADIDVLQSKNATLDNLHSLNFRLGIQETKSEGHSDALGLHRQQIETVLTHLLTTPK